ncbi:MAG: histidine phosphatase family protein [Anaerolineales bacterium]|nr:histidine phosphatase family protein [Anaerolineales bacterium]
MTDLWLLRHGQTDWNVTGRWQGQTSDAPGLNDMGYAQALAVRNQLKDARLSAIYSSDLLRSRQTAELIAEPLGLTVALEPRLREINLGAWEGMLSDGIESKYPQELAERAHDPLHARAPQGESPLEVEERVIAAVADITEKYPDDSVLIVSHGISLAIIICHVQEIPMEEVYEHIPENAKPYRMEWK